MTGQGGVATTIYPIDEVADEVITSSGAKATDSLSFNPALSSTTVGRNRFSRFSSILLPISMAAAFAAPVSARTRYRVFSAGTASESAIAAIPWDSEAAWIYEPEPITWAQVESLNRLLALPYFGEVDFPASSAD